MNDSSTGGVLLPAGSPAPAQDADLDAILQVLVSGITTLDGTLVRPRWQSVVPKQPEPTVNWCAIGVMAQTPDAGPYIQHIGSNDGSDSYVRHETLDVLASFYGPQAAQYAALLRDGLAIPQNTESLSAQAIRFIQCAPARLAPELVNQQWVRRCDVGVTLRRKVLRTYTVKNVLSADIHLIDDTHVDELIAVTAP